MAWMKRLAETYDLYQDLAGIVKDGQPVLLPVSHSTINAQIEVTLNEAGEFVMGKVVEKGDEVTIIPVTEDSAARSSGVAPHPLCDKLCYVAGDYSLFVDYWLEKAGFNVASDSSTWGNYSNVDKEINGLASSDFGKDYKETSGKFGGNIINATGTIEKNKSNNIYDWAGISGLV